MTRKRKKILRSFQLPQTKANDLIKADQPEEPKQIIHKEVGVAYRFFRFKINKTFSDGFRKGTRRIIAKTTEVILNKIEVMRKETTTLFRITQLKPKKFLVIGFNQASVEMVHVETLPAGVRILAYDTAKLLPEEERREEAMEKIILDFIQKNSISDREVSLSISDGNSVVIHNLVLPFLPKAEVLKAAKWKLKEEVQFDLDSALIDWQFIKEHVGEDGLRSNEYVFAIAEKEAVNKYLSIIEKCGFNPINITVGSFNYANILKRQKEMPEVSAVLDVDYTFATLGIYIGGKLSFVRKLPVSRKMFTRALTRTLVSEGGSVNLSVEEAEEIQRAVGIPDDEAMEIKPNIRGANIMFLLRPSLEALVRELNFSFNYFTLNSGVNKPEAVFVVDSGSGLKNLEEYLGKMLGMAVLTLALPECAQMPTIDTKGSEEKERNKLVNSAGAALGDSQAINLLPKEIRVQGIELLQKVVLRFICVTVGLVLLVMWLNVRFQINDYRKRIKISEVHLDVIEGIRIIKEDLRLKESLIEKIQKGKIPVHSLLRVIGVLTPKSVVLDSLFFDQSTHSLILRGSVLASEETTGTVLASFMQQLEYSPFFNEASLVMSQRGDAGQRFEIECDLVY